MPIIQVYLLKGRTAQQKAALIAALTESCQRTIGASPETVRVILEEMEPENFGKGGAPWSQG